MTTASVTTGLPIILLPGLNGNRRVFARQQDAFPSLLVPTWIKPERAEPLSNYAARFAAHIDTGVPCVVGGVSFGGILALSVASHLKARACVLMATCRDARGLPRALRLVRRVTPFLSPSSLDVLVHCAGQLAGVSSRQKRRRMARLSPDEAAFRRWAMVALLIWQPPDLDCPVFQVHGEYDATFSAQWSGADVVVRGAGHLLTVTHPGVVNDYLRAVMWRITEREPSETDGNP
jgi:pimeloyl-ACP methyl ester carboxylesterase